MGPHAAAKGTQDSPDEPQRVAETAQRDAQNRQRNTQGTPSEVIETLRQREPSGQLWAPKAAKGTPMNQETTPNETAAGWRRIGASWDPTRHLREHKTAPQRETRAAQRVAKSRQRDPRGTPSEPSETPRGAKGSPKRPQWTPKAAQGATQETRNHQKDFQRNGRRVATI